MIKENNIIEEISIDGLFSQLKEYQNIENISVFQKLKSLPRDKIVESKIFYNTVNGSKMFIKAYIIYGPVRHKLCGISFCPIYNSVEFIFNPYLDEKLHLNCIYEIEDAYEYALKMKTGIGKNSTGTLKYIQGIGEFNCSITREPFTYINEPISIKFLKDWLSIDYNQIIWQPTNKIVGEYSTYENHSHYFELPQSDLFHNIFLLKKYINAQGFDNRNYSKRIQSLNKYRVKIKKGILHAICFYSFYQGDNPLDDQVSFDIKLKKLFEIINENTKQSKRIE